MVNPEDASWEPHDLAELNKGLWDSNYDKPTDILSPDRPEYSIDISAVEIDLQ